MRKINFNIGEATVYSGYTKYCGKSIESHLLSNVVYRYGSIDNPQDANKYNEEYRPLWIKDFVLYNNDIYLRGKDIPAHHSGENIPDHRLLYISLADILNNNPDKSIDEIIK